MIEVPRGGQEEQGSASGQRRLLYLDNKVLNLQIFRLSLQKLSESSMELFNAIIYAFDDYSTINEVS
jgi:hypothetical protein